MNKQLSKNARTGLFSTIATTVIAIATAAANVGLEAADIPFVAAPLLCVMFALGSNKLGQLLAMSKNKTPPSMYVHSSFLSGVGIGYIVFLTTTGQLGQGLNSPISTILYVLLSGALVIEGTIIGVTLKSRNRRKLDKLNKPHTNVRG